MPQQDDFYGTPRGASLSWGLPGQRVAIGEWRGGLVLAVQKGNATEMGTGKPKFWPDGNGNPDPTRPIKQIVITVATNERDPNNPVDNGVRSIFIEQESLKYSKKGKYRPGEPKEGVKYGAHCDAMVAAGHPRELPEPGGLYYLCLYGEQPGAGSIPRGLWAANYQPPTPETLRQLDQFVATTNQGDDLYDQAEPGNPYGGNGQQRAPQGPPAPPTGPPQGQPQQPTYAGAGHQQWQGNQQAPTQHQPPANTPVPPQYAPAANYQQGPPAGPPQGGYTQQNGYAPSGNPPAGPPVQFQQGPPPAPGNPHQSGPPQQQPTYAGNPYQQ